MTSSKEAEKKIQKAIEFGMLYGSINWIACLNEGTMSKYPNLPPSKTNPNNEPTGHFTGRCMKCGSSNLWDDNLHYGCDNCGAFFSSDTNPQPRLIPGR